MKMSAPADIFYFAMPVSPLARVGLIATQKKRAWGALFIR